VAALSLVALALPSLGGAPSVAQTGTPPIGMVCTEQPGDTTPTFDLVAKEGYIYTPDGNSVYMWGYGNADLDGDTVVDFQFPGPVLCVEEGDTVTVNLVNQLSEPVSIVFPGQSGIVATGDETDPDATLFTAAASASGGTASYEFKASNPGTYLYESGTNPHRQVQMGLFGALVVRPASNDADHVYAYNDVRTEYDPSREFLIVLHEIDPELHLRVEFGRSYNRSRFHARYWTVNGRNFPDTIFDNSVPWLPYQPYGALVGVQANASPTGLPALIRYANASMDNHPFHPHGDHLRVIGRDGSPLMVPAGVDASMEAFTKTIGSGQSYELLFEWEDVDLWNPSAGGTYKPIPVKLPSVRNLIFKDSVTWYSGSPYLGCKGPLPVGTASYNELGEYYFPWHSHDLIEFTNFNEGFGGLATLLRVDPPPDRCP